MNTPDRIKLTNRHARTLNRLAVRTRTIYYCLCVLTIAVTVMTGVWSLMLWWQGLFICLPLGIALSLMMLYLAEQRYETLISQALCTEAAVREIHALAEAQERRDQAISDLKEARPDAATLAAIGHIQMGRTVSDTIVRPRSPEPIEIDTDAAAPRRRRQQPELRIVKGKDAR